MNHYKKTDQGNIVGRRAVLTSGECNISLGFLKGILNTRDGKALGEIYENHIRMVGSINIEQAFVEMIGGLV